ncbi:response regulator [Croceicoccus sp. F390]|uniref:Response regulator n=1 Tax=Croceicoccus esteveae TaxID=3075597 RepID=A0ABU2ZGN3_9SPHN|nr:response regulator [Croceicoccus sp. F390]MDT0575238.1 response regulator [Croceicoccus sp. F390]
MIRILLAEDDDMMRSHITRVLHLAGHDVVAVRCGTEALPLLKRGCFDLLLCDIVMPEMDGIELAQRCGRISPETKIVFITGFAAVAMRANRSVPNAKVLSKPFHLKDLVRHVEDMFNPGMANASL